MAEPFLRLHRILARLLPNSLGWLIKGGIQRASKRFRFGRVGRLGLGPAARFCQAHRRIGIAFPLSIGSIANRRNWSGRRNKAIHAIESAADGSETEKRETDELSLVEHYSEFTRRRYRRERRPKAVAALA